MENHYTIIDSDHKVFTFGKNEYGQLGIGNRNDQELPVKIENLPPIVETSVGNKFTLFLDDKGFVLVSGKIGIFETVVPQKIIEVSNISKISSGWGHCLLLGNDGSVFSFGWNLYGQLGRNGDVSLPSKIEGIPSIKFCCCGDAHSILIDADGGCYSFGENHHGQLGLGDKIHRSKPAKIYGLPPIVSASCGDYHTILVAEDGIPYGYGGNYLGRLGFNSSQKNILVPTQIAGDSEIKQSYCNGSSTILQDVDNNFWAFGANEYGELGLGHNNTVKVPTKIITLSDISSVLCFTDSIIFINENGECFASGKINNQMIPTKMECPEKALILKAKRFHKTKNARNQL